MINLDISLLSGLHLAQVIYNGRLSKTKDLNLSSSQSVHPMFTSPVSVPLLNTSLRNMWIKSVSKPLGSGITISSDSRSLDTLLSTGKQTSSAKNTTPSPVDITIPNVWDFSDQVHNFTWNYTTTYSPLVNSTIRCNAVARYFHTERRGKSFLAVFVGKIMCKKLLKSLWPDQFPKICVLIFGD